MNVSRNFLNLVQRVNTSASQDSLARRMITGRPAGGQLAGRPPGYALFSPVSGACVCVLGARRAEAG